MSIIDTLQSKEVDIYISLASTVFGLILGTLVDTLRKKPNATTINQRKTTYNLTVNNVVNPSYQPAQNNQELTPLIAIGLLMLLVFYAFYKEDILNTLLYLTIFIISLGAGDIIRGICNGYFTGASWAVQVVFSPALCIASLIVVNQAFSPDHAPRNFEYLQPLVNKYGIIGATDYFYAKDVIWLLVHLLGVFALIRTQLTMALSAIYFIAAGHVQPAAGTKEAWLIRKTRNYAKTPKRFFWDSILLLIAYGLISGIVLSWLENELPVFIGNLFNAVLHGR